MTDRPPQILNPPMKRPVLTEVLRKTAIAAIYVTVAAVLILDNTELDEKLRIMLGVWAGLACGTLLGALSWRVATSRSGLIDTGWTGLALIGGPVTLWLITGDMNWLSSLFVGVPFTVYAFVKCGLLRRWERRVWAQITAPDNVDGDRAAG